jgi:N-acetylmuramidase/Putative peptidoglycan binding domain
MGDSFVGKGTVLDGDGLDEALDTLGTGQPELWAVLSVETGGSGYLPDRRPRILFERHIFSRETDGKYDTSHPDISNPRPGGYLLGAAEYDRLSAAIQLDRTAALLSASWGLGQVMGFNAIVAGFADVDAMVQDMVDSENAQLWGMATWIDGKGIADALKSHRWGDFAKVYNGRNYKKNQYDTRLAGFYEQFEVGPLPDLTVRAIQYYLICLGYSPGKVDGILGRLTRAAIEAYQARKNLSVTREASEALARQLNADVLSA